MAWVKAIDYTATIQSGTKLRAKLSADYIVSWNEDDIRSKLNSTGLVQVVSVDSAWYQLPTIYGCWTVEMVVTTTTTISDLTNALETALDSWQTFNVKLSGWEVEETSIIPNLTPSTTTTITLVAIAVIALVALTLLKPIREALK